MSVISERCHAETSFGFLITYEEEADVTIEMDDDFFSSKWPCPIEITFM